MNERYELKFKELKQSLAKKKRIEAIMRSAASSEAT